MLQLDKFQQSTTKVVELQGRPQPSTGVATNVLEIVYDGDVVKVWVTVGVYVGLIVRVSEIVLVLHGVQERESVGGQVIVGVGLCGTMQQIVRSAHEMHTVLPEAGGVQ